MQLMSHASFNRSHSFCVFDIAVRVTRSSVPNLAAESADNASTSRREDFIFFNSSRTDSKVYCNTIEFVKYNRRTFVKLDSEF